MPSIFLITYAVSKMYRTWKPLDTWLPTSQVLDNHLISWTKQAGPRSPTTNSIQCNNARHECREVSIKHLSKRLDICQMIMWINTLCTGSGSKIHSEIKKWALHRSHATCGPVSTAARCNDSLETSLLLIHAIAVCHTTASTQQPAKSMMSCVIEHIN